MKSIFKKICIDRLDHEMNLTRLIRFVCDLQPNRVKSFVNRFHLILHACVQTCDVMFLPKFFGI